MKDVEYAKLIREINILYDLEIGSTAKVKMDKDTVYLSGEIYEG